MQAIHLINSETLHEVFGLGLKKSGLSDRKLDFVVRQSQLTLAVLHEMDIRGMNWMIQFDEHQRSTAEIPKKYAERRDFIPATSPLALELFITQENEKTYHILQNVVPNDNNNQLMSGKYVQLWIDTGSHVTDLKRSIETDTTQDANKKIAKLDGLTGSTNEPLNNLAPVEQPENMELEI
ncbi:hypothetical protein CAEBREN_11388 [Caenorhabditis brenneri]|uniref:Uncharacterized protein n=1 Tax=Caenorhabditis brenneri TaxID=135651 RepID=G0MBG4_CAEBE|nr:hypothetical protein CAEBREN_11388 [Caenorhabditis brenneri]